MNLKTTLVLVLLVGIGFTVWFLELPLPAILGGKPAAPAADAGTLDFLKDELKAEELTRIEIQQREQRPFVLTRPRGGEWSLLGGWRTRPKEVETLVQTLTGLRSRFAPIPLGDEAKPEHYGVEPPALTVLVHLRDQPHRLRFGEKAEDGGLGKSTYLRLDNRAEVVRLGPQVLPFLSRPADHYQQRRLFPMERVARDPDSAEKMEQLKGKELHVRGPAGSYTLLKADDDWQLAEPFKDRTDPDKLRTLLAAVADLWAEQFITPKKEGEKADYGLDEPEQTIHVVPAVGDPITLLIGKVARTEKRKVARPQQPGMPQEVEDVYRYARRQGVDQVFEVKADKFTDFFVKADTLRDPRIARFRPDDVTRVEVARGASNEKKAERIILTKQNTKQKKKEEKEPARWEIETLQADADTSSVRELLNRLNDLTARDKAIIPQSADDEHGLKKPVAVITLTIAEPVPGAEPPAEGAEKPTRERTLTLTVGKPEMPASDKAQLFILDGWARVNAVEDAKDELLSLLQRPALAYLTLDLWQLDAGAIAEVRIRRGEEEQRLKREGQTWKVVEPFETALPENQAKILSEDLARPRADRYVTHAAEDLKVYGLDQPAMSLTVIPKLSDTPKATADKQKEYTLLVGKPTEKDTKAPKDKFGDSKAVARYAKLGDGKAVFVLSAKVVEAMDRSPLDYLNNNLLSYADQAIQRIERERDGEKLAFQRKGDEWQLVEGPGAPFSAERKAAEDLMRALCPMIASRFVAYGPKADLAKYGLDKPVYTFTFAGEERTRETDKPKPFRHVLALGKEVEGKPNEFYARLDNGPAVFVLPATDGVELVRAHLHYVDRTLLDVKPDAITGIRRRMGDEVLEIGKKGEVWQVVQPAELRADESMLKRLAQSLAGLKAEKVAAYRPKDLKAFGLEPPAAVVTVRLAGDGKPDERVLRIGKEEDEKTGGRFVTVEGSDMVGVLPRDLSRQLTAAPAAFRDRSIASFDDADRILMERGTRKATFTLQGTTWNLTEPVGAAVDRNELEDFLTQVQRLRADEIVAEKPGDLKPFGLDRPEVRWRFQKEGKDVLDLLVGAAEKADKKEGIRRYAKLAGGSVVFLLDPPLSRRVVAEYRNRDPWPTPLNAAQVERLTYTRESSSFALVKEGTTWNVADKPDAKVNQDAVRETLMALRDLKVAHYAADQGAKLKLFGLEPPQNTLVIQTPTGKRVLHFGRTEGESKRLYARVHDEKRSDVFVIAEQDAAHIVRTVQEFTQAK